MTSTRAPLPTFVGPASGKKVEIRPPTHPEQRPVAARPAAHLAASSTRRRDAQIWVRSPAHASRRRSRRRSRGASSSGGSGRGGGARRTYSDVAEDAVKSKDAAERKLSREGSSYAATARDAFRASARDLRAGARREHRRRGAPLDRQPARRARRHARPRREPRPRRRRRRGRLARRTPHAPTRRRRGGRQAPRVPPVPRRRHRARRPRRPRRRVRGPARTPRFRNPPNRRSPGSANALAAWGDLLDDPREAAPVLERAERRYETAANAELARLDRVDAGPASSAARSATFMSSQPGGCARGALEPRGRARETRRVRGSSGRRRGGERAVRLGVSNVRGGVRPRGIPPRRGRPRRVTSRCGGCGLVAAAQTLAGRRARRQGHERRAVRRALRRRASRARRRGGETSTRVRSSPRATSLRSTRRVRRRSVARNSCFACLAEGRARVTCTPRRCTPWRRSTPRTPRDGSVARRVRRRAARATRKTERRQRRRRCRSAAERGRAVVLVLGDAAKAADSISATRG